MENKDKQYVFEDKIVQQMNFVLKAMENANRLLHSGKLAMYIQEFKELLKERKDAKR